ncbi:lytic transglycosylase domain-containing protein [Ramlibacter sp. PS4R-6]|uniref:lytic transglycosylase domain-containing protein n=1 Tax=Ramlibacter sp. PS4R-6 TaxID=3133438 RepID=UPI0030A608AF
MIARRELLWAAPWALLAPGAAFGGAQAEEPIAESALNGLRAAIGGDPVDYHRLPQPHFPDQESRLFYLRWLGAMNRRLTTRMDWEQRRDFLQTVWYEARRASLDPALVLGLIQVESNFNKFAVSRAGARGYMQVMPFWARLLVGKSDVSVLFHMQTNLRFGCVILRYYLRDRENGDLFMALGRYNGSRGRAEYPNAVLRAKRAYDWKDAVPPSLVQESQTPPTR